MGRGCQQHSPAGLARLLRTLCCQSLFHPNCEPALESPVIIFSFRHVRLLHNTIIFNQNKYEILKFSDDSGKCKSYTFLNLKTYSDLVLVEIWVSKVAPRANVVLFTVNTDFNMFKVDPWKKSKRPSDI